MEHQLSEVIESSSPGFSPSSTTGRTERKKYLKQTGKSLWIKNKTKKATTLSIEVSTQSSDSSASFLDSNYQGSTNEIEKGIYAFLDHMSIKQVNFSEMMKTTVITFDNKVKFLSSAHDAINKSNKVFAPKKVSSLWERRKQGSN